MARTTMNLEESQEYQIKFVTEVYEHKWTLQKWFSPSSKDNPQCDDLTYEINTGKPNRLQTKWIFGIERRTMIEPEDVYYEAYWKMVEMENFEGEIEAKASISTCYTGRPNEWAIGESEFEKVKLNSSICKIPNIDPLGDDVTLILKLIIKIPINDWTTYLHKMCHKKAETDFLGILKDKSTADLKIITSDEKELFAHKLILRARCSVFEHMFRSYYIENHTGIVHVEDVSGKTMGILLHFFYSGQLLPSWRDQDTIVEFLYAAGKYQITEVLEILDFNLATQKDNDSELVEQLLDITNKLALSNAEARLIRSVKKRKRRIEVEQMGIEQGEVEEIELEN